MMYVFRSAPSAIPENKILINVNIRSELTAVSRKEKLPESHLLTKVVPLRCLNIGLIPFVRVYGPRLLLDPQTLNIQYPVILT